MLYENWPMGAIVIDPANLRVLSANTAACRLLTRDAAHPQGRPVTDFLPSFELDDVHAILKTLAPMQPRTIDLASRGNGTRRGAPSRVTVELMEMSDRRQILLSFVLGSPETAEHSVFNRIPAMVWQSDAHGKCTHVNQDWLAFTGQRLEQERGDGWFDDIHPDDLARSHEGMQVALQGREPFRIELRLRHHSGDYRWVRSVGRPYHVPSGAFAGYVGACFEIDTERKLEAKLVNTQVWMEHVQEIATLGGWELDIATGRMEVTNEACRLLGYAARAVEPTVEVYRRSLHPEDKPRVMAVLESVLSGKRERYRVEYRIPLPDGSQRNLLEQGQVVLDRLGAPERIVATVLDITDHKRHEEALGNLVQGVAAYTDRDFFNSLVVHLGRALNMRFAFIARPLAHDAEWAETLAASVDGEIIEGMRFRIADSPCHGVSKGRPCVYPSHVRQRFPNDRFMADMGIECYLGFPLTSSMGGTLGWLVVMDCRALPETQVASDLLRIFAARAAVEVERLDTLAASEESERRFRATFEHASVGMALTDLNGRVVQTNPALRRLLGWDAEELHGETLAWFADPKQARLDTSRYHELAAGRISHYEMETSYQRKDGSFVDARVTVALVRNERGQPECALQVIEERLSSQSVDTAWALVG